MRQLASVLGTQASGGDILLDLRLHTGLHGFFRQWHWPCRADVLHRHRDTQGEWELTLTHPLDDAGKWRRLVEGCILRAPVPAAMTPGITMITRATPEVKREVWKVRTNGSRLMLRSGTGTKYKIIGKYHNGTEVVLLEKTTSSWYKMLAPDGKQGYMSTDWLQYVRTEVTPLFM